VFHDGQVDAVYEVVFLHVDDAVLDGQGVVDGRGRVVPHYGLLLHVIIMLLVFFSPISPLSLIFIILMTFDTILLDVHEERIDDNGHRSNRSLD